MHETATRSNNQFAPSHPDSWPVYVSLSRTNLPHLVDERCYLLGASGDVLLLVSSYRQRQRDLRWMCVFVSRVNANTLIHASHAVAAPWKSLDFLKFFKSCDTFNTTEGKATMGKFPFPRRDRSCTDPNQSNNAIHLPRGSDHRRIFPHSRMDTQTCIWQKLGVIV